MRVRTTAAAFAALATLLAPAVTAQAETREEPLPPVRILPLGDSITHGGGRHPGGYRTRLKDALADDGASVDFVGSLRDGPAELADPDHEGHLGLRIDELGGIGTEAIRTYRPRYVLLLAGTNNVLQGHDVPGAPRRLVGLVDELLATSPQVVVVVSTLPPLTTSREQAAAVNSANIAIRDALSRRGGRVVLSEAGGALATADIEDGVHPSLAGYARLGDGFATSLLPLLQPRPPVATPTAPATWPGRLRAQYLPVTRR